MWKYIATPLIGAVIGYVTNWIAVKMLFRPRKEIRVFGKRLPFTPGVIPRGQGRLARAVGNVVETQLLTPEYLGEKLLSKESEEEFKSHVQSWIDSQKASEDTLYSSISNIVEEDRLNNFIASAEESLSDFLSEKIIAMEPGKLIVDKVMQEAQNKLSESMFGMMLGGSFLEKIAGQVQDGIDTYIQENAREYVGKAVVKESKELQEKPMPEVTAFLEEKGISCTVINMHTIKPLDTALLEEVYKKYPLILTVEEHNIIGGLGGAVAEHKSAYVNAPRQIYMGITDEYKQTGSRKFVMEQYNLTSEGIVDRILKYVNK